MSIRIVFILFFIISSTACQNKILKPKKLKCHQKYSPSDLKTDFNFLTKSLRELHPDLYRVNSKEIINSRIDKISKELDDSLSYLEFLKLIAPLLTDIGCINTQWGHSKEYIEFRNNNIPIFPLKFKIQDERFIINENKIKSLIAGEEIIEINGTKVSDYLIKNYPLLPIDGKIKSLQNRWLESYFPNHHSNFWEQSDTFYLKIKGINGEVREEKIKALLKENIDQEKKEKTILSFNIKDSIAILKIGTFNDNVLKRNGYNFKEFLDSTFKKVDALNLNHLIIDMRGNSWGNIDNGALLFSYLSKDSFQYVEDIRSKEVNINPIIIKEFTKKRAPQEINYKGPLYVITNGWNINAGGFFCIKIKNRPNTVIYGETAGNSYFGMNAMSKNIILPHSRINCYIPTAQFIANINEVNNVEGIPLDLELNPPFIENTIRHILEK